MRPLDIGVITNPNSKKNALVPRRLEHLEQLVADHGQVHETQTLDELRPVIREFLERGVRYWVSDGGDGSLHWMLNELVDELVPPEQDAELRRRPAELPCLVPTNGGTIDFVAKKAGVKGYADDILQHIVDVHRRGRSYRKAEVPTLLCWGYQETEDGLKPFRRLGFASSIWGIGRAFFDLYYQYPERGKKTMISIIGQAAASTGLALAGLDRLPGIPESLRRYKDRFFEPLEATVFVDGRQVSFERFTVIDVGAFAVDLGGLVHIFPYARDGTLHVQLGDLDLGGALQNLVRIARGHPLTGSRVWNGPSHRLDIYPARPIDPVFDGEIFRGVTELHYRLGPTLLVPRIQAA